MLPTFAGGARSTETTDPLRIDWREALSLVRANASLWRLLIADFMSNFATSATAALYIFFASYVFELPNHASTALLLYFFAGFCGNAHVDATVL